MRPEKGWRCHEHQGAERPCAPARCQIMSEAQSLQDRIEAIIHLASEGSMEAIGADGLTPSAALEAIEILAESVINDECAARLPGEQYVKWAPITPDEEEPEAGSGGRGRQASKPSRVPKIVPAVLPNPPSDRIQ